MLINIYQIDFTKKKKIVVLISIIRFPISLKIINLMKLNRNVLTGQAADENWRIFYSIYFFQKKK